MNNVNIHKINITFPTHVMVEKVLFLGQILKMEILMDLHIMRSPESENHIFSVWSECVSVILTNQKQITAETSIWYSTFVSCTDAT